MACRLAWQWWQRSTSGNDWWHEKLMNRLVLIGETRFEGVDIWQWGKLADGMTSIYSSEPWWWTMDPTRTSNGWDGRHWSYILPYIAFESWGSNMILQDIDTNAGTLNHGCEMIMDLWFNFITWGSIECYIFAHFMTKWLGYIHLNQLLMKIFTKKLIMCFDL
jgi:hypothetical protein